MTIHFAVIPVILILGGVVVAFASWVGGLASWGSDLLFMLCVFLFCSAVVAVVVGIGMQIGVWADVR